MESTLVLGDTHFPWQNKKSILTAISLAKKLKPKYIVQIGDLYDNYSASSYPKNRSLIKPTDEFAQGRAGADDMWRKLRAASPASKCYQILGNHCIRPLKLLREKAPELEPWIQIGFHEFYSFDGVNTVFDHKEELVIDGVYYQHGFRKQGEHADHNKANTVHGHTHRACLTYTNLGFWELDVGWLGDVDAECFSYRAQRKIHGTTQGVGIIDSLGPRFVPFF